MSDTETLDEGRAFMDVVSDLDLEHPIRDDAEIARLRRVWLASRDYHRQQAEKEIAAATRRLAVRQGARLMDCPHMPSCASVAECTTKRVRV